MRTIVTTGWDRIGGLLEQYSDLGLDAAEIERLRSIGAVVSD